MNAYVVRTRDQREYVEPVMDDGSGPRIPYLPIAPVVAETAPQAKRLFLDEYAGGSRGNTGVYHDDWNELRVRLLCRDVTLTPGLYEDREEFWVRIHEIESHGGGACDCVEPEWDETTQDWKQDVA